ncbi:MAG: flavin reductase family protein [Alphaproteobacteria bacterium]|nr:flavin reductase family protein [Alphaproteobacteria bacterium]
MFYDALKRDHGFKVDPLKALIVPRPIGWISTVDPEGKINLAPYSFYNAISEFPPMVYFGVTGTYGDSPTKHSRMNAELTGEFVVNMVSARLKEKMNVTTAMFAYGVDEMREAGLTPAPCRYVKAPRVAESPLALECKYWKTIELPIEPGREAHPGSMVIGQVVGVHIDDSIIKNGRVDVAAYQPVARLGYSEYTTVTDVWGMRRPDDPRY